MPNKINDLGGGRPVAAGPGRVTKSARRASNGAPSEPAGSSESVHITDAASQLAALEQATREMPVVNEARVAAVSSAIEQGTYTVVPRTVADRLLKMESALAVAG